MEEPQIKGLSYQHRQTLFIILALVFLIVFPALIFYTTGYRLSFDNEETSIVSTGGIYITTDNLEVDVYLDDEQVERPRLFRSAYYIQNISAGQHRVVVQRPDLHTWVKELPVDRHMVIEAAAFNMPVIPHIRPIAKYETPTGGPVFLGVKNPDTFFSGVTTTQAVLFSTSTATTSLVRNDEYTYVESLFSTTSTSTRSVFERLLDGVDRFRFATTSNGTFVLSTTTQEFIEHGNTRLVERDSELYAVWLDSVNTIPYYYCIYAESASSSIAERYGDHVAKQIEELSMSTTTPLMFDKDRICRSEIRLDRKHQDVFFYDFFPNSSDLVLLQLEDGLYVTEIDDRAWQNVQLIYPGSDFQVVVENNVIYVKDRGRYFEIITKIEPS